MRLSHLQILNHSRIDDLCMHIRRHAVIVGANDVGKSSILRLLDLTLGATMAGLYQGLTPADLRDPSHPLIVNIQWGDFSDRHRRLFPSEISIEQDQETEYLWVQLIVEVDPDDAESISVRRWFPEAGHERGPNREQLQEFGWRYLRATRSSAMIEGARSPIRTLMAAAELGSNEDELKSLINEFNQQLEGDESLDDLLRKVANHLSRTMPKEVTREDLAVRSMTDPSADVLKDVSIFLNRRGEQVSLLEQSDGVRQLMSMALFDLAEGTANVIAIDEPELHLHPTSQRTAAELLSGEGNQKIIVTHSPYILHRFEPSEVIAVDRLGRCHQIEEKELTRVEKLRAHWWSPRLLEALTARFVILVEGDADRVIVEAVAKTIGVELDKVGAVVVELDGADKFKNVFPLLGPNGFGPTLFGLVDKNESEPWINAFRQKRDQVLDRKVFVSDIDLEDEYTRALGGTKSAEALVQGGFCRRSGLLQAASVDSFDSITPEAVAKFIRAKGKVEAATCIAASLDEESAKRIDSVWRLLGVVSELSNE